MHLLRAPLMIIAHETLKTLLNVQYTHLIKGIFLEDIYYLWISKNPGMEQIYLLMYIPVTTTTCQCFIICSIPIASN